MSKRKIFVLPAIVFLVISFVVISLANNQIYGKNFTISKDSTEKNYPEVNYDASKLYPEESRKMINGWFTPYLGMKSALANDNFDEAQKYSVELMDVMESSFPELSKTNSTPELTTFTTRIQEMRKSMTSASDINEQRKAFNMLNESMMPFLQTSGMYDKSVYILSCPEDANYGNAIWFSDGIDTGNPYVGAGGKTDCIMIKENWNYK